MPAFAGMTYKCKMNHQDLIKTLSVKTESKIVMLIMDGLGGMIHPQKNFTELEAAKHPNLDQLAKSSKRITV